MEPLRVGLVAALEPGHIGGVTTVVRSLVAALGQRDDGIAYTILVHPDNPHWLDDVVNPRTQRVVVATPRRPRIAQAVLAGLGGRGWGLGWGALEPLRAAGCQVVHVPYQWAVSVGVPVVYNPHDLQHRHLPGFFDDEDRRRREQVQSQGCRSASRVVVASRWLQKDVCSAYGLSLDRVDVIPWAPPTSFVTADLPGAESWLASIGVRGAFALYPAMTWPHKNHQRLLEAVALLKAQGRLSWKLVCPGHHTEHYGVLRALVESLGLQDDVHFPGLLPAPLLAGLYRRCRFVVVPTLFEAVSGPVFEAWDCDAPVTCSTVTSLPEQVGDAALLFDPLETGAIADAMHRLATDDALRTRLKGAGRRRRSEVSWATTAATYEALYRRLAGPV